MQMCVFYNESRVYYILWTFDTRLTTPDTAFRWVEGIHPSLALLVQLLGRW